MKKISEFFEGKRYLVYIVLGIILFTMVFKSQVVILSYGDDYTLRMEYTIYGYCIRASASQSDAEPAVYNEVYIGNSMSSSVLKAVGQLEELSGTDETVKLKAMGFPRNNDKLETKLKQILEDTGRTVELYDDIESQN